MSNQIPVFEAEGANPSVGAQALGAVIRLTYTDPEISKAIAAGYKRLVIERSTDGQLSFHEISVPSERPVLDAAKPVMEFYDRRGDANYFYRFRYVGDIAGEVALTDPSVAIEGIGLALRGILTVAQLKDRYLFGVDFNNDKGEPLPDAVFEHYIYAAIRWMEHQLDISILPTAFLEQHDYYREDYNAFGFIRLDNYPVISVEEFRVQYPSGSTAVVFPAEWLRINKAEGHIQIVPSGGSIGDMLVGQGGAWLPAIYSGRSYLPQLFSIEHTAGFEAGRVPRNIIDIIGMFASLGPFNIFGDLIAGAGIATLSLSMDGLSQSVGTTSSATNAGYGARIIQYLKQIKEQIPVLRRYYRGVRFTVA